MKSIAIILFLALLGFYLGPTFIEGADSQCDALVAYAMNRSSLEGPSPMAIGMIKAFGPLVVKKMVQERYPDLPPQLTCAGLYWKAVVDPDGLQSLRPSDWNLQ